MNYDVIVIGGGPAGAALARRLAAEGARAVLLTGTTVPGVEGLSRRTRELLGEEGIEMPPGAVLGPVRRGGEWGQGRELDGSEWLIERRELARHCRAAAVAGGVTVCAATVVSIARDADGFGADTRTAGRFEAPLLVDSRGRRGAERRGPLLLALGQRFDRPRGAAPATSLHAAADGWCWLVEAPESVWVQLVGRPRQRRPGDWLAAARAAIPALERALEGARPAAAPVARPAHARLGRASTDPALWRVGDAALALDPLSGQGVYEALRGARLVATAINSVGRGGDAGLAQRFIAERHEYAWRRGVAAAAAFYAENAARGAFWSGTAAAYRALDPPRAPLPPRVARRPVLEHGRIHEREVLLTAVQPRGVWQVEGVPVVDLIEYFRIAEQASITGAAAAFDRPPAAVETARRWLLAVGALPAQGAPPIPAGG